MNPVRIVKILHIDNKHEYAIAHVLTSEGDEATVYIGGECDVFYDKGKIKCHIKRRKSD